MMPDDTRAKCDECGMPYEQFGLDVTLPNLQWSELSGRDDGGGLLCARCIIKLATATGKYHVAWMVLL